jgi:hypothetical protein
MKRTLGACGLHVADPVQAGETIGAGRMEGAIPGAEGGRAWNFHRSSRSTDRSSEVA